MVIYGKSGIDEVDISEATKVWEDQNNYLFKSEDISIARRDVKEITTNKKENTGLLRDVLAHRASKPIVELVLLNTAAAIKICRAMSWAESYEIAEKGLRSKRPLELLNKLSGL